MQQLTDYIRAYAPTYARTDIDLQLRTAGHDEITISRAWDAASGGWPVADATAGVAVSGGGGIPAAGPTRGPIPAALFVVIALASVIALTFGIMQFRPERPGTNLDAESIREAGRKQVTEKLGVSDAEADAIFDTIDGTISGSLPKGWKEIQSGMWVDTANGNNVNVATLPDDGLSVLEAARDTMAAYDGNAAFDAEIVSEPRITKLGGREAGQLKVDMSRSGITMSLTQWFVASGDDEITIISSTMTEAGEGERDEIKRVVDQLVLGD